MDNKKLMHILLNDILDLQELVSEMKTNGTCDAFDLELLHTRISGIRHMLEVVSRSGDSRLAPAPDQTVVRQMPAEDFQFPMVEAQSVKVADIPVAETHPPVAVPDITFEVPHPPVAAATAEAEPLQEKEPVKTEPEHEQAQTLIRPVAEVITAETSAGDDNDDVGLEEISKSDMHTIGERFVQGRSVNDLLLEQGKPDTKFSNMPVSSLKAAIGINDRFLFTRELFDGDGKAFFEVISKIDGMGNIHEAAVFLRENYKWKKNDTSLKFIDLVKRRFL
jgi:hypothetical protein